MPDSNTPKPNRVLLHQELCPKSKDFKTDWMLANEMGPNAVWLSEILAERLGLQKNQRLLDLGCGRAMSSIFLAQTYGVRVWATDLWISADDNWERVVESEEQDAICPVRAEARNLPFAAEFFDAVFSVDSYQYYGTDDLYLGYILRFLRTGGRLALVMPAMKQEFDTPPEHLTRTLKSGTTFWDQKECWCLHTLQWWRKHFEQPGLVDVEVAEYIPDGWRLWLEWEEIRQGGGFSGFPSVEDALREDAGRYVGFTMFVLTKRPQEKSQYDHSLLIRL